MDFALVLSNRCATCSAAVAGLTFDVTEWCVEECDTSLLGDGIAGLIDEWSWWFRVSQYSSSMHGFPASPRDDCDGMP